MPAAATNLSTTPPAAKPHVAIVGGGIAGLTCALRLVRSGCRVTLYEATDRLGGNISSAGRPGGPYQDVYPHIFPDWYANLWDLLEVELGMRREDHFAARWGVKVLDKPQAGPSATEPPAFMDMVYRPTPESLITTMKSGVVSVPDMFLFAFLTLDLASQPPDPTDTDMLCQLDVNGFFYSRGYSTDAIAALQDYIISVIWSAPSNMTSAKVYKQFIKHQLSSLGPNVPYSWMLRGSLHEKIIAPIEQKLLESGACEIRKGVKVRSVEVQPDGTPKMLLEEATGEGASREPVQAPPADYVVMAVPAMTLSEMVMAGQQGQRLVDKVPDLAQLRRVWGEAIPVVNLYFKRKLPFVPQEIIGLRGSGYDLTVLDISQLWDRKPNEPDVTVLVLAASNAYAIPSPLVRQQGYLMIKRLRDYLWFNLGEAWGADDDIDWERTSVRANERHLLFVNDVGSRLWRPKTRYDALPRVFFAGDVCQTDVDMATVEAAVQSGVMAAAAIQQADKASPGGPRMAADPIALAPHKVLSDATFLAAKLALLPLAYGASAWSAFSGGQAAPPSADGSPPAYSPGKRALLLPFDYAVDWWRTVYWLQRALLKGAKDGSVEGVDPADAPMGLGVGGLWATGRQPLSAPAPATAPPGPSPSPRASVSRSLLAAAAVLAGQTAAMLERAAAGRKGGADA
ncbi:FAD-dependent oxidoreductase [Phenylobacterium montanum]|uniref:FAD-dependent oxidoreductase n=1 Tax=Phenylobacterium montanum TaxID=2823693 RepID=A0A975G2G7_9CAUL|nr:FAD-dependent oxidoreductase [Caulobacter sp. S6]QUD89364.1 FAD-dependent oxidoreductase [Caulobacter sp. S6]